MKLQAAPETVQAIIAQAGGLGWRGAFIYIGAEAITYRCAEPFGECRPDRTSRLITEGGPGFVDYQVGVGCLVNGKRGRRWTLIIAYEPDDTYTVWLVEGHASRQTELMVLTCQRDVYCHELQAAIEGAYDGAIRKHNGGLIPVS